VIINYYCKVLLLQSFNFICDLIVSWYFAPHSVTVKPIAITCFSIADARKNRMRKRSYIIYRSKFLCGKCVQIPSLSSNRIADACWIRTLYPKLQTADEIGLHLWYIEPFAITRKWLECSVVAPLASNWNALISRVFFRLRPNLVAVKLL